MLCAIRPIRARSNTFVAAQRETRPSPAGEAAGPPGIETALDFVAAVRWNGPPMSDPAAQPLVQPSLRPPPARSAAHGAIVIGASSGIGAALVRRLVREGWNVAALARRADKLDELARACAAEDSSGRVFVHVHDTREVEK